MASYSSDSIDVILHHENNGPAGSLSVNGYDVVYRQYADKNLPRYPEIRGRSWKKLNSDDVNSEHLFIAQHAIIEAINGT